MLSGLLKNEIAIQVSINIMDAFVEMRKIIANNFNINNRVSTLEYQMIECHEKFDEVFNELQKGKDTEFNQKIFFDGQIYDAYSLIIDIIKSAKEKILIIDNYIDDNILKMLAKKNKNVDVVILTSQNCNLTKQDYIIILNGKTKNVVITEENAKSVTKKEGGKIYCHLLFYMIKFNV